MRPVEKVMRKQDSFLLLALLSLLFLLRTGSLNAQMHFEQIGNTKLIPDNVVTDLKQDLDGYLWIATAAGVVRYDGYRFKLFENDPLDNTSLGGNFIRDINVFEDGTLWFSTEPGGVSIYHPETENFSRLFDEQTLLETPRLSSVSQVLKGQGNEVWLSTNAGIFRATTDGQILRHYTTSDGMPHNGVRAILRDKEGHIWIGTRSGLTKYSVTDDQFTAILPVDTNAGPLYIRSLFEAQDGRIWVGTNTSGMFIYDDATEKLLPTLQNQPDDFRNSSIYDIFQFSDNELWLARFGGIDRIDAQSGQWLTRVLHDPSDSYGLANNDIRTLLRDSSGVIWVGGYGGGVQRLLSNPTWQSTLRFSLLQDNALTEPNVSSVLALKNGLIWVGTRGGGINIVEPSRGVIDKHLPEVGVNGKLQSGWIPAMAELPSGQIWVAANPGQLYRLDGQSNEFIPYGAQQGLPRGNIRALEPSSKGGLWIGTNAGLLYWDHSTDSFISYPPQNGESLRISVNALHEDQDGHLWVATGSTGLYAVEPDKPFLVPVVGVDKDGVSLQTMSVLGMLRDSKQRLWLDTPAGLYLAEFDSSGQLQLDNHSQRAGFPGRPLGANILEDSMGQIWSPVFIYNPESGQMTPLQRADGVDIGTSWFRSYSKTPDGKFLFGGSRGLLTIDPYNYSVWDFKPPIVASELRVDGVHVNAGMLSQSGLTLNPAQRGFAIEFAALDLSAPEQNKYRYRLTGFDEKWIEVDSTRRLASYSNLWPGKYTFSAQGTNRSGQWSDKQLTFDVTIKAAYWQTPWFIAVCVLLIASLIYEGFRIRTRLINARAEKLENEVNERTQELRKAQQDIIEQEKMASLGGLVAGVSHEINTPMGIALTAATALTDDYKSLEKKLNENSLKRSDMSKHLDKARSSNQLILNSLERACELMNSFKQVAVDQTSEQRRHFELKKLLKDIERALHSLYYKKGHSLQIECPEGITMDSYPGAVFQVFTNLINNSIIHGFVEKQNGTIQINAELQDGHLVLVYQDDGIGMTPEIKRKAFEPFFTTKMGVGGSGLGLHLVYNYVSQILGGKIKIETAQSRGFGCKIEIPLVAPDKEEG